MPRKAAETTIKLVAAAAPAEGEDLLAGAPLFAGVGDDTTVSHIMVIRTDPDEGTLGRMPPNTTELEIKRKWGGGTFQLQARDERNRMIKNGFKTIVIGGDPIFESKAAQVRWKRQQGLEDDPASTAAEPFSIKDIFALLASTEARQKADAERRAAEQEAAHRREIERIRIEAELRSRERAEEDGRRERQQQEREDRRRKEDEEREERRRKDDESARARDREFQVMLASLAKKGGDGSDMLLKGIEIANKLGEGGGGNVDPVSAVAAALLPGLLDKGAAALGGAKPAAPAASSAPAAAAASAEAVTFDGELGKTTRAVVAHLTAQGFDPETSIASVFEKLLSVRRTPPPGAGASPGAPSDAPAPTSKATPPAKRRTTKK